MNTAASRSIVIVDDEPSLRALLLDYLGGEGYRVRAAASAVALDLCLAEEAADLIVLDVNMPGEDGLSVARRLRRGGNEAGIVMLTAAAGQGARLEGFAAAVDDYVAKPFEPQELLARVRSVLRRVPSAPRGRPARCIPVGPHFLDPDAHVLTDAAGEVIGLTAKEMKVLLAFLRHPGRVLTREALALAAGSEDGSSRAVDLRVMRLRRKIELPHGGPQFIRTVAGVGYVFDPDNRE